MKDPRDSSSMPRWMPALGLSLVVAGYLFSLWQIQKTWREEYDPEVKTLRVVHWQLERGVREALQRRIEDYERLKAGRGEKVRILQQPVSEKGYGQFVRTNMIGGTLPDLVQFGRVSNPADLARYFLPLTGVLARPNPYNAGTPLEGAPWRDTFFDNLRFSYIRELQDYYNVGFSAFTIRLFYNRDLLRRATGLDRAPAGYEDFLAACETIRAYAEREHLVLHPIASSADAVKLFEHSLMPSLIGNLTYDMDYSYDGNLTIQEKMAGYLTGAYKMNDPEMRYAHEITTRLTRHFAPGFMAVKRDESVRQFLQGQAVFYTSGSWDIPSLQFGTPFELGVTDFPYPDASHPVYGPYFDGRPSEAETATGFAFSVARRSEYPGLAVDFLQYMTSLRVNETLNREMQWIPAIRGARVDDFLKPFLPNPEGSVNPCLFSLLGDSGKTYLMKEQAFWPFISGKMTYEEYAARLEKDYVETAAHDLRMQNENNRRGAQNADLQRWVYEFRRLAREAPEARAEERRRFHVATETLHHSMKDTLADRMILNRILRDPTNERASRLARALGLREGEPYVP